MADPKPQSKNKPQITSAEIFRGSSNIDLSPQGLQEAKDAAKKTAGQFTEIHVSPLKRAQDTAREIRRTNPQVAELHTETALEPWFLGQHEGKPVTPERIADVNDRIKNRPDEPVPGRGKRSTADGESFNDFKDPLIELVIEELAFFRPGEKILNVTHYRDVQAIKSWLAAGAPDDLSINTGMMTEKGDQEPGDLYHLDPETMKFKEVTDARQDGIYFLRHGATEWNAENSGPSPNTEPDESAANPKDRVAGLSASAAMDLYNLSSPDEKRKLYRAVRDRVLAERSRGVLSKADSVAANRVLGVRKGYNKG